MKTLLKILLAFALLCAITVIILMAIYIYATKNLG